MSDVEIDVIGADRLSASMRRAARKIDNMRAANDAASKIVERRGRQNAPKRTGRLARSIVGRAASNNAAEVGSTLIYAPVIHNGWPRHHITANPFLTRALDQSEAQVVDEYREQVQDVLSTVKGA